MALRRRVLRAHAGPAETGGHLYAAGRDEGSSGRTYPTGWPRECSTGSSPCWPGSTATTTRSAADIAVDMLLSGVGK